MPLMDHPPTSAGQKWQTETETETGPEAGGKLPSFYSPPTRPSAAAAAANEDVSSGEETSLDRRQTPAAQHHSERPSASLLREALGTHPARQDPSQSPLPPPPSLLSPAFTPPGTPGTATPTTSVPPGVPVDSTLSSGGGCGSKKPRLLETLPEVQCIVRARIPTVIPGSDSSGSGLLHPAPQMFLHLYKNNVDDKEHLAIVFGNSIRSSSLGAPRPGETEMDRMIRGAYTGVLYPGRTTSGQD
ncbi:GTP cyclohydrolase-2, partial [Magnaporthiopsis poae ATCC 64411]